MTRDRSDLPPFPALKVFETFGRVKGIRATAEALGVDPGAVSRQLQAIEAWFGVQLVDRTRHPADLSDAGRRYHEQVTQSFMELRAATDALRFPQDVKRLNISCAHGLAHCWLVHQIHLFKSRHPDIALDLRPTDLVDYDKDEIVLDIRFFLAGEVHSFPGHLRAFKLIDCEARPVASKQFLATLPDRLRPADLSQLPLLDCDNGRWWMKWFARQGLELAHENTIVNCWHMDFVISMARRGDGLALATPFIVGPDDGMSQLHYLDNLVGAVPMVGTYYLVQARKCSAWPSVRAFRTWIHTLMNSSQGRKSS